MSKFLEFFGLKPQKRAAPLSYPVSGPPTPSQWYFNKSKSGAVVNDYTIMGVPPFWAAVRCIAGSLAAMESCALRRTKDGHEEADGHPVYELFKGRPHPNYTKYDFIHALVSNACLGNGYARIHWNEQTGRPRALEILPSAAVWPEYNQLNELVYKVTGPGGIITLPSSDVIHVKGFMTYDAVTGRQVSYVHKEIFGSALSAVDFPSEYFKNGVHSPGFLTRPEIIGVDEARVIQAKVADAKGVANAGGMPFFDGQMSFVRIGSTMQDAALIDFSKLSAQQCSQITGVPLHMMAENSHSTFTNMEQQSADYVTHCVNPWAVKLEQEFSTKLFTPNEIRSGRVFYNFDVESIIRGDTEAIAKMITSVIPNSVMTPNEVRQRFFKMNKADGGDKLLAQVNMTLLDKLEDLAENQMNGNNTSDTPPDGPSDTPSDNSKNKDNADGIPSAS